MASRYGVCDAEKVKDWIDIQSEIKRCVHRAPELAYAETVVNGLIPCRVLGWSTENRMRMVVIEYTVTRGAYRRRERETVFTGHVVPRGHVYVKDGMIRIGGNPWYWTGPRVWV